MVHARKDYNRFQDPAVDNPRLLAPGSTPIAVDEPVMLFRAQDRHFVDLLLCYKQMLLSDPNVKSEIIEAVQSHIDLAIRWQRVHGSKTPDLPEEVAR